ncbi:MAG TPA: DUF3606 domain-containing protein [Ramlibacter sp.]|nr:DUF3606 domain-containing protein [Ramlibacter sp.]
MKDSGIRVLRPQNGASRHEAELRQWSAQFGTTPERLEKAIEAVGIAPRRIRQYLIRDSRDHDAARLR